MLIRKSNDNNLIKLFMAFIALLLVYIIYTVINNPMAISTTPVPTHR